LRVDFVVPGADLGFGGGRFFAGLLFDLRAIGLSLMSAGQESRANPAPWQIELAR
jgi:hypothetical protein